MIELKAGVMRTPHNEGMTFDKGSSRIAVTEDETEFYLKSEADEVIAKLKTEIEEQKRLRDMALASMPNVLKVMKIIQHQKYKRCINMANWCFSKSNYHYLVGREEGGQLAKDSFRRSNLYLKWCDRWQKLAEQFSPMCKRKLTEAKNEKI